MPQNKHSKAELRFNTLTWDFQMEIEKWGFVMENWKSHFCRQIKGIGDPFYLITSPDQKNKVFYYVPYEFPHMDVDEKPYMVEYIDTDGVSVDVTQNEEAFLFWNHLVTSEYSVDEILDIKYG